MFIHLNVINRIIKAICPISSANDTSLTSASPVNFNCSTLLSCTECVSSQSSCYFNVDANSCTSNSFDEGKNDESLISAAVCNNLIIFLTSNKLKLKTQIINVLRKLSFVRDSLHLEMKTRF